MNTDSACRHCGRAVAVDARFCSFCGTDASQGDTRVAATDELTPPRKPYQDPFLDLLRTETLGDYEILGELGRGGMATVYLAHDIALDRKVAIKVISSAMVGEAMAERFRREARTAAALNHPHIIPIYAVRDRNPLLFFAMKFIAGQSLDPILRTAGALPIPMVQAILSQAGSALGYAHRRGVIHRDVKPANIMIDDEGWVLVTDFGIAKVSSAAGLTGTGVTVGTPAYMSPEQCLGKDLTGASDQYSLGMVGYEMLTGQPPFKGDSAMALMFARFNDSPKPIHDLRPDCPPALADTVMRMLDAEPEKRWPTMDDAIGAVGAQTLPHDDPVRRQLIAMAVSGENSRIVSRLSTPTSPVPPARRTGRATTAGGSTPTVKSVPTTPMETMSEPTVPLTQSQHPLESAKPPVLAATKAAVRPLAPRSPRAWWPWAAAGLGLAVVAAVVLKRPSATGAAVQASPPVAVDSVVTAPPADSIRSEPGPISAPAPAALLADRIEIVAQRGAMAVGELRRLSATPKAKDGSPILDRAVEWSSSAPAVATVSGDGTVRAVAPGRATFTASMNAVTAHVSIDVVPAAAKPEAREAVASVVVSPSAAPITVGGNVTLTASALNAKGKKLDDRTVTWSVSAPVVSVNANGQVTGVAPGSAVVTAWSEGRSASATITVTAVAVASVNLGSAPAPLGVGDSVQLNAVARDARGGTLSNRPVSWESSDPAVATVASGLVIARRAGTATITATSEGQSASHKITVNGPPPVDPAVERAKALDQINRGIAAFVDALNRRDVGRLRQAYPGISSAEEQDWSKLLTEKSLTRFEAVLGQTQAPRIDSGSADVVFQVRMTLNYSGQPTENQRVEYQAVFRPEGGTWRLMRLTQH